MHNQSFQNDALLFKALAHPVRIAILELLRGGEQCVCHMEAALGRRQAYISQQLAVLREAGLILDRREGLNIFYQVVRPEVFELLDSAHALTGAAPVTTKRPEKCPCPKCTPEVVIVG